MRLLLVLFHLHQVSLRFRSSKKYGRVNAVFILFLSQRILPWCMIILCFAEIWMATAWEIQFTSINFLEQIGFWVTFEGFYTKHDSVKDYTCCPVISGRTQISSIIANFRRHESWSSTECLQLLVGFFSLGCEAKINNLCDSLICFIIHKDIL